MEKLHLVPYPKEICRKEGQTSQETSVVERLINSLPKEAYFLRISKEEILIEGDKAGIFYGRKTLEQLRIQFGHILPCMDIYDKPRFSYRGYMLDSSRHFLPKEDVMKIIDVLAFFKINMLHWHLADDQGFRIQIDGLSKLTEIGAKRGRSYFGLVDEEKGNDGYFTKEDVKEIVAYAKERMIEVVPELEIPGHESALLAAYPEAGCTSQPVEVVSMGGIFDNLLCAGKEESFEIVKKILDGFLEVFPYEMIHIGGDEAVKRKWRECPDCQKKIREMGLKDENALQQWYVKKVQAYLKEKGKTVIVWNDSLRGGELPADFVVQMWMGDKDLIGDFIKRFGKIIQSSTQSFYLDYPYALWDVKKILNYEICPEYLSEEAVLGVECPLWMERITDLDRVFHLILPRLPAMAECGWTEKEARDNDSFFDRYRTLAEFLQKQGIKGAPECYWQIGEELAKKEMEEHNRIWYTPKNRAEFARQEAMMARERAIYGDER